MSSSEAVDLETAIVIDEAEAAEFVHEEIDPRARGADHFRQRFLVDRRGDVLGFVFLAEIRQQQKHPRQPLLAGIEQLVDQILFDAKIAVQQIGNEQRGKFRFVMQRAQHCRPRQPHQGAIGHRRHGRHAPRVAVETSLAEKIGVAEKSLSTASLPALDNTVTFTLPSWT